MATLVAHRLAAEGFPVRAVYTYGSPRPGDRNFRDAYRLPNYRFVNDNDLVPHLPLRWCYRHVGHLKLLTRDGQIAGRRQRLERQEAATHQACQARAAGPSQRRRSAFEAGRIRLAGRSSSRRLSGRHCPAAAARSAAAASRVCRHRPGRHTPALHRRAGRADRPPAEDARRAARSPAPAITQSDLAAAFSKQPRSEVATADASTRRTSGSQPDANLTGWHDFRMVGLTKAG